MVGSTAALAAILLVDLIAFSLAIGTEQSPTRTIMATKEKVAAGVTKAVYLARGASRAIAIACGAVGFVAGATLIWHTRGWARAFVRYLMSPPRPRPLAMRARGEPGDAPGGRVDLLRVPPGRVLEDGRRLAPLARLVARGPASGRRRQPLLLLRRRDPPRRRPRLCPHVLPLLLTWMMAS